jgi:thiol-disulfide isomerase/thioredoxin
MTKSLVPLFLAAAVLAFTPSISKADVAAERNALVEKVKEKAAKGENSEEALAEELKGFDALLAAHKDEKTDEVAEVAYWKALIYIQLIPDHKNKAIDLLKQIVTDYPDTAVGKQVPRMLALQEADLRIAEARKRIVGLKVRDFDEKDIEGHRLSIASRRGKVLLIDFWATFCPPCVAELPNLLKTYEKYHDKGFEIIGVSLDHDKETLTSFLREKNVTWPQYFDGHGFQGKLAEMFGVMQMPTTLLLDKEGKLLDLDLRGGELEAAVAKALAAPAK